MPQRRLFEIAVSVLAELSVPRVTAFRLFMLCHPSLVGHGRITQFPAVKKENCELEE
jgi:hypothetical protein